MSGHSKFANIKHKKEKMMLQKENLYKDRKRTCSSSKRRRRTDPANNSLCEM